MNFWPLPEHFNCSFNGRNSPVILRAEAACDDGGMIVEEYGNQCPHIHLYGDTTAAKRNFALALQSLGEYVDLLERHDLIQSDQPRVQPTWFQFELRHPTYRATLWGDYHSYNFSWVIDDRVIAFAVRRDMICAYRRLRRVYEQFFDTTIARQV